MRPDAAVPAPRGRINGPFAPRGRVLVVAVAYAPGRPAAAPADGRLARWLHRATLPGLRAWVAMWRDHYANPRDPAVHAALVRSVCNCLGDPAPVCWWDDRTTWPEGATGGTQPVDLAALPPLPAGLDGVVLVYADALGLGAGGLEATLLARVPEVWVVNGRRRAFRLTPEMRRALALRRFLARTRLVEFVAGLLVVPLAALLALVDAVRGHDVQGGRP